MKMRKERRLLFGPVLYSSYSARVGIALWVFPILERSDRAATQNCYSSCQQQNRVCEQTSSKTTVEEKRCITCYKTCAKRSTNK